MRRASSRRSCPTAPGWSSRIVFCAVSAVEDGTQCSNLFVVRADGSNLEQRTEGDRAACRPVWSPDGCVYFHANVTERFHIWRLRLRAADDLNRPVIAYICLWRDGSRNFSRWDPEKFRAPNRRGMPLVVRGWRSCVGPRYRPNG
jgi:Tol biopolymer transport system component